MAIEKPEWIDNKIEDTITESLKSDLLKLCDKYKLEHMMFLAAGKYYNTPEENQDDMKLYQICQAEGPVLEHMLLTFVRTLEDDNFTEVEFPTETEH